MKKQKYWTAEVIEGCRHQGHPEQIPDDREPYCYEEPEDFDPQRASDSEQERNVNQSYETKTN